MDPIEKELRGMQEMLGFVLAIVGHPVVVPKDVIKAGIPENVQIEILDDIDGDAFIFRLAEKDVPKEPSNEDA
jgi:hypothetical protein